MNPSRWRVVVLCGVAALSACTALGTSADLQDQAARLDQDVQARQNRINPAHSADQRRRSQHVARPWIAGRPQPLARDVTLPAALRARTRTTLLFAAGPADLVTLAERIQLGTGIPVRVEPDALLPAESFMPRLSGDITVATPAPNHADTWVPDLHTLLDGDRTSGPSVEPVHRSLTRVPPPSSRHEAPLSALLDMISLRLNIYWRYDPDLGAIVFYRTQTRSFVVQSTTLTAEADVELGLSGHRSHGGGSGPFASRSASAFRAKGGERTALDAVVAKIEQLLTRAGAVRAPDSAGNTVVVTDTPDALQRVEQFLAQENRALTRRVRLHFEEITIRRHDQQQAGIDWTVLFKGRGVAQGSGPEGLADSLGRAASLAADVAAGPWQGSSLRLQALSELGTIVRQTRLVQFPMNRRPATYAMRETFSYIKDLQQTQSASSASAPTVTVTQDDETVGTFLTLVPDIQDDGRVLLTVAYDNTRADLDKLDLGAPGNPSFVQQKKVSGEGSIQQVALQPGQPAIIAGLEQTLDTTNKRRLDRAAPLLFGGGDNVQRQRLLTLLVVTAMPEDG